MASNVVKKIAPAGLRRAPLLGPSLLSLSMLAGGCMQQPAQQTAPLRLSVMNDQVIPDHAAKDSPYMNPDWRDNDEASDGLFFTIVSQTGMALNTVFSPVVSLTTHSIAFFSNDRPTHAYQLMEDRNSADNRREGMNRLADFGFLDSPNFRKRCRQIAQYDADASVRAAAIRISNRARDAEATGVFVAGLSDTNDWVRLESAKALANVPDVKATDLLVKILNNHDESRDIRIAAADALKHYRTLSAARALTTALDDKSFAISWQARRSLRYLTDRDFGYASSAWLAYFTGPSNPLRS